MSIQMPDSPQIDPETDRKLTKERLREAIRVESKELNELIEDLNRENFTGTAQSNVVLGALIEKAMQVGGLKMRLAFAERYGKIMEELGEKLKGLKK